ncbi:uncharacterized protein N7483_000237 [Penicillium malachiteum]|uniref:uncharacterized protein n=1 Tax=Penicillium malachiteum TaxID=1324776 RepID=UPI002549B186|nr:uncharacterized protein N7483_000237 [Penicillium malachiteum]KAJ5735112.1 hypothetical protein N7483_000237 [Penicillium malachiteum]
MATFSYLPTELVMQIAEYLQYVDMYEEPGIVYASVLRKRQATLANFCLVNKQWYSVAISKLYCSPSLLSGESILKFLRTLCPNHRDRRRDRDRPELGLLIHTLNLGNLVHHSSNSRTARLINKARKMRIFTAPQYSFSLNCLAPLSKCSELRSLDLSRIYNTGINFPTLKNTISKLENLWRLCLPASIPITHCSTKSEGGPGDWPHYLGDMILSGEFDHEVMEKFEWPPHIESIKITQGRALSNLIIDAILSHPTVQMNLEEFIIDSTCSYIHFEHFEEVETSVMYELPCLDRVQIPCDLARFFGMFDSESEDVMGFKSLTLTEPVDCEGEYLDPDLGGDLIGSVEFGPLCLIWGLEVPIGLMEEYALDQFELDELIVAHLDDVSDDELDAWPALPGFSVRKKDS